MEKLKNLCGQIPEELHNQVRAEQESLGLSLGKYLERVLTAHFTAPAPSSSRSGDRTLAFQVPEELFQRVKQYLEDHKTGHRPLSQKAFVVGLIENALTRWESGEEIVPQRDSAIKGGKERTLAVIVPGELFDRVKQFLAAHDALSQRDFVLGLIEQEVSAWENRQAVSVPEEGAEEAQQEPGEVPAGMGADHPSGEEESAHLELTGEQESTGPSMISMM